jgi:ABC-2 type transport system permease protein
VPRISSWLPLAALTTGAAAAVGALGVFGHWEERSWNIVFFALWGAAVFLLFALAFRLPLRLVGPRYRGALWNALLAGAAIVFACAANVAVFRHDVHLDLSREGINTPPPQLAAIVDGLRADISLTYFYNSADENALKAKELLAVAARQNRHFQVRAVDLDKEPALARRLGIRAYNTALLEAENRRVVVENTVDLAQMSYAVLRVLRKRVDTLCLVTGHGESVSATPAHFHYSHLETLKGHDVPGAGDVLVGERDGLDRLQLAVTALGYTLRPIAPTAMTAIPGDCVVVADIGPRRAYAPGEAGLLAAYLAGGGRLLLMLDPTFPMGSELGGLLDHLGVSADPAVVIDPLNHYGSDADKVAVPYYPPHPITNRVAMSIFPEARPIRVAPPPPGIVASVLATSSNDSYLQPVPQRAANASADTGDAKRGAAILAVALEGVWPGARDGTGKRFRLVLVGNSNFATNAYFPYVSNGELAVGIIRWLADDESTPMVKPQSFSLTQIDLTARQMRDIFVAVELLLPLSVVLAGGIVWWRRR